MRKSTNQNIAYCAEHQLLSCNMTESAAMLAATFNGNELTTNYSSVHEQMKQQPLKSYR